ncbi:hypothetical protein POVWA2_028900 [Plasmodium ovale wallikeri]|uniref:Uncharacterized protein n=1 Tax=Plasmodium ovale wallikeri TaxID=864142 RepID=A0A1A8YXL0_PLAOA|nr:hypothetical protein POVWA2_028900 [Plasmodium ovale wallikeri]SBT53797.1 hypothetical protein POVWA1_065020 [Plasmodium ovale wallikeri]
MQREDKKFVKKDGSEHNYSSESRCTSWDNLTWGEGRSGDEYEKYQSDERPTPSFQNGRKRKTVNIRIKGEGLQAKNNRKMGLRSSTKSMERNNRGSGQTFIEGIVEKIGEAYRKRLLTKKHYKENLPFKEGSSFLFNEYMNVEPTNSVLYRRRTPHETLCRSDFNGINFKPFIRCKSLHVFKNTNKMGEKKATIKISTISPSQKYANGSTNVVYPPNLLKTTNFHKLKGNITGRNYPIIRDIKYKNDVIQPNYIYPVKHVIQNEKRSGMCKNKYGNSSLFHNFLKFHPSYNPYCEKKTKKTESNKKENSLIRCSPHIKGIIPRNHTNTNEKAAIIRVKINERRRGNKETSYERKKKIEKKQNNYPSSSHDFMFHSDKRAEKKNTETKLRTSISVPLTVKRNNDSILKKNCENCRNKENNKSNNRNIHGDTCRLSPNNITPFNVNDRVNERIRCTYVDKAEVVGTLLDSSTSHLNSQYGEKNILSRDKNAEKEKRYILSPTSKKTTYSSYSQEDNATGEYATNRPCSKKSNHRKENRVREGINKNEDPGIHGGRKMSRFSSIYDGSRRRFNEDMILHCNQNDVEKVRKENSHYCAKFTDGSYTSEGYLKRGESNTSLQQLEDDKRGKKNCVDNLSTHVMNTTRAYDTHRCNVKIMQDKQESKQRANLRKEILTSEVKSDGEKKEKKKLYTHGTERHSNNMYMLRSAENKTVEGVNSTDENNFCAETNTRERNKQMMHTNTRNSLHHDNSLEGKEKYTNLKTITIRSESRNTCAGTKTKRKEERMQIEGKKMNRHTEANYQRESNIDDNPNLKEDIMRNCKMVQYHKCRGKDKMWETSQIPHCDKMCRGYSQCLHNRKGNYKYANITKCKALAHSEFPQIENRKSKSKTNVLKSVNRQCSKKGNCTDTEALTNGREKISVVKCQQISDNESYYYGEDASRVNRERTNKHEGTNKSEKDIVEKNSTKDLRCSSTLDESGKERMRRSKRSCLSSAIHDSHKHNVSTGHCTVFSDMANKKRIGQYCHHLSNVYRRERSDMQGRSSGGSAKVETNKGFLSRRGSKGGSSDSLSLCDNGGNQSSENVRGEHVSVIAKGEENEEYDRVRGRSRKSQEKRNETCEMGNLIYNRDIYENKSCATPSGESSCRGKRNSSTCKDYKYAYGSQMRREKYEGNIHETKESKKGERNGKVGDISISYNEKSNDKEMGRHMIISGDANLSNEVSHNRENSSALTSHISERKSDSLLTRRREVPNCTQGYKSKKYSNNIECNKTDRCRKNRDVYEICSEHSGDRNEVKYASTSHRFDYSSNKEDIDRMTYDSVDIASERGKNCNYYKGGICKNRKMYMSIKEANRGNKNRVNDPSYNNMVLSNYTNDDDMNSKKVREKQFTETISPYDKFKEINNSSFRNLNHDPHFTKLICNSKKLPRYDDTCKTHQKMISTTDHKMLLKKPTMVGSDKDSNGKNAFYKGSPFPFVHNNGNYSHGEVAELGNMVSQSRGIINYDTLELSKEKCRHAQLGRSASSEIMRKKLERSVSGCASGDQAKYAFDSKVSHASSSHKYNEKNNFSKFNKKTSREDYDPFRLKNTSTCSCSGCSGCSSCRSCSRSSRHCGKVRKGKSYRSRSRKGEGERKGDIERGGYRTYENGEERKQNKNDIHENKCERVKSGKRAPKACQQNCRRVEQKMIGSNETSEKVHNHDALSRTLQSEDRNEIDLNGGKYNNFLNKEYSYGDRTNEDTGVLLRSNSWKNFVYASKMKLCTNEDDNKKRRVIPYDDNMHDVDFRKIRECDKMDSSFIRCRNRGKTNRSFTNGAFNYLNGRLRTGKCKKTYDDKRSSSSRLTSWSNDENDYTPKGYRSHFQSTRGCTSSREKKSYGKGTLRTYSYSARKHKKGEVKGGTIKMNRGDGEMERGSNHDPHLYSTNSNSSEERRNYDEKGNYAILQGRVRNNPNVRSRRGDPRRSRISRTNETFESEKKSGPKSALRLRREEHGSIQSNHFHSSRMDVSEDLKGGSKCCYSCDKCGDNSPRKAHPLQDELSIDNPSKVHSKNEYSSDGYIKGGKKKNPSVQMNEEERKRYSNSILHSEKAYSPTASDDKWKETKRSIKKDMHYCHSDVHHPREQKEKELVECYPFSCDVLSEKGARTDKESSDKSSRMYKVRRRLIQNNQFSNLFSSEEKRKRKTHRSVSSGEGDGVRGSTNPEEAIDVAANCAANSYTGLNEKDILSLGTNEGSDERDVGIDVGVNVGTGEYSEKPFPEWGNSSSRNEQRRKPLNTVIGLDMANEYMKNELNNLLKNGENVQKDKNLSHTVQQNDHVRTGGDLRTGVEEKVEDSSARCIAMNDVKYNDQGEVMERNIHNRSKNTTSNLQHLMKEYPNERNKVLSDDSFVGKYKSNAVDLVHSRNTTLSTSGIPQVGYNTPGGSCIPMDSIANQKPSLLHDEKGSIIKYMYSDEGIKNSINNLPGNITNEEELKKTDSHMAYYTDFNRQKNVCNSLPTGSVSNSIHPHNYITYDTSSNSHQLNKHLTYGAMINTKLGMSEPAHSTIVHDNKGSNNNLLFNTEAVSSKKLGGVYYNNRAYSSAVIGNNTFGYQPFYNSVKSDNSRFVKMGENVNHVIGEPIYASGHSTVQHMLGHNFGKINPIHDNNLGVKNYGNYQFANFGNNSASANPNGNQRLLYDSSGKAYMLNGVN